MPNTATLNFDFTVQPAPVPLHVTSAPPPPAVVGVPYTYTFTADGGVPPYKFALSATIPGLSLDAASGVLSGTPTSAGVTAETLTVTDSAP